MYEMNGKKSDEELVALAQNGDKQATEALMLRHAGLVRGCARGFFLIGGETEDLIQEGMIGLYGAIGDYQPSATASSFKTFVLLLAVNVLFPVSLVVKLTVFIKVPFTKVLKVIVKFAL